MVYSESEIIKHQEVIDDFLQYINNISDKFILKGGTALLKCYGLDRFSEDLDFDAHDKSFKKYLINYCKSRNYVYYTKKNTLTGERYTINYGLLGKVLKIDLSFRDHVLNKETLCEINGILTYKINSLCIQKILAFNGRDKIRDLYDIIFILDKYYSELSPDVIETCKIAFQHKGLKHCDYLVSTQSDILVDSENLSNKFLDIFNKLGLLDDSILFDNNVISRDGETTSKPEDLIKNAELVNRKK